MIEGDFYYSNIPSSYYKTLWLFYGELSISLLGLFKNKVEKLFLYGSKVFEVKFTKLFKLIPLFVCRFKGTKLVYRLNFFFYYYLIEFWKDFFLEFLGINSDYDFFE